MNKIIKIKKNVQVNISQLPLLSYEPIFKDLNFMLDVNPYILENEKTFFNDINKQLLLNMNHYDS